MCASPTFLCFFFYFDTHHNHFFLGLVDSDLLLPWKSEGNPTELQIRICSLILHQNTFLFLWCKRVQVEELRLEEGIRSGQQLALKTQRSCLQRCLLNNSRP